jgi:hypothetical protein
MHYHIAVAGTDDGDVVDAFDDVWQKIGDFDATFSEAAVRPLRAQRARIVEYELVLGLPRRIRRAAPDR